MIWKKYIGKISDPQIPMLFDYSYAGYRLGEVGIPNTHEGLKTFDVTEYGAVANDDISDQEAIQSAIGAAEMDGGGIVFFPPGRFLVNVAPEKTDPVRITSSNIILRGSGMGQGGTTIEMKDHMLRRYSEEPEWRVSYMFVFEPEEKSEPRSTVVTTNAAEGELTIEVENTGLFEGAKYLQLKLLNSLAAVETALAGKPVRPHWERIREEGVSYYEIHEIKEITGNTITLSDPLVNDVEAALDWRAYQYEPLTDVGVEDIHFRANFSDKFEHHKDFIHDNAWSIVSMNTVASSWVRRCRFSNVTGAVSLSDSYASSVLMLVVDGNSGHKLTNVAQSSRILTGLITDLSTDGQFHGASMSHYTSGSVIWRVDNPKQGWDSHAQVPKNNLVDLYEGAKMTAHGGNFRNEPHHLRGLTLWNYERIGEPVVDYDFWSMSGRGMYWGFSVVDPIIVGFHGSQTTFDEHRVGYLESLGKAVLPASLYEAQLKHRLGELPAWLERAKAEWQKIEPNNR